LKFTSQTTKAHTDIQMIDCGRLLFSKAVFN
jgi:hypothetical protein